MSKACVRRREDAMELDLIPFVCQGVLFITRVAYASTR